MEGVQFRVPFGKEASHRETPVKSSWTLPRAYQHVRCKPSFHSDTSAVVPIKYLMWTHTNKMWINTDNGTMDGRLKDVPNLSSAKLPTNKERL